MDFSLKSLPGERLDRALRTLASQDADWRWLSRSAWDELFAEKRIQTLAGKALKPSHSVSEFEVVRVHLPGPLRALKDGSKMPVQILAEANDIIFFAKPAGIPSYPLRPWEEDSAAHRLAAFLEMRRPGDGAAFQALAEAPLLEGGLTQRLDTDTSGIVSAALTSQAKEWMRKEFSLSHFTKTYWALVEGESLHEGVFELFLRPKNKTAMQGAATGNADEKVILSLKVLASNCGISCIEVTTRYGARHVVRASLAYLGHPLLGDLLYGAPHRDGISFHQLHAVGLKYQGDHLAPILCEPPQAFVDLARSFDVSVRKPGIFAAGT